MRKWKDYNIKLELLVFTIFFSTTLSLKSQTVECIGIDIESGINIPNVFTPNLDMNNDGFNVQSYCITSLKKEIYNRWGQLLFQSNQISEPWYGRTNTGDKVPGGVYFYIFTIGYFNDGVELIETYKGSVTLLR